MRSQLLMKHPIVGYSADQLKEKWNVMKKSKNWQIFSICWLHLTHIIDSIKRSSKFPISNHFYLNQCSVNLNVCIYSLLDKICILVSSLFYWTWTKDLQHLLDGMITRVSAVNLSLLAPLIIIHATASSLQQVTSSALGLCSWCSWFPSRFFQFCFILDLLKRSEQRLAQ